MSNLTVRKKKIKNGKSSFFIWLGLCLSLAILAISYYSLISKYLFRPSIYQIGIRLQGLNNVIAPGVAIVKNGHTRYFTVAHYFTKGIDSYFSLDDLDSQPYNINRVQYLGLDLAELFIGKAEIIYGCTNSNPQQEELAKLNY